MIRLKVVSIRQQLVQHWNNSLVTLGNMMAYITNDFEIKSSCPNLQVMDEKMSTTIVENINPVSSLLIKLTKSQVLQLIAKIYYLVQSTNGQENSLNSMALLLEFAKQMEAEKTND